MINIIKEEVVEAWFPPVAVKWAVGHFRVASSLCFKARLSVKPLTCK